MTKQPFSFAAALLKEDFLKATKTGLFGASNLSELAARADACVAENLGDASTVVAFILRNLLSRLAKGRSERIVPATENDPPFQLVHQPIIRAINFLCKPASTTNQAIEIAADLIRLEKQLLP